MKYFILILFVIVFLTNCSEKEVYINTTDVDSIARSFVKLCFALGRFDNDFVDAYFGPVSLKKESLSDTLSLKTINDYSDKLLIALSEQQTHAMNEKVKRRIIILMNQINALKFRCGMLLGIKKSFNAESKSLYDIVFPTYSLNYYKEALNKLNEVLPGKGDIILRYLNYRKKFIVPTGKIDTVFRTAMNEARMRTNKYIELPSGEDFQIEYVKNQPWGAYNWFKGNALSLIQVNVELPVYIDFIINLASHEGYPGHHVFHSLTEQNLYRKNKWIEYSIYPLFSPMSFISEGTANYGIEICFPGNDRITFEKNVLFKLAGLNSKEAENYYMILGLTKKLSSMSIEIARRYLDGNMSKEMALNWLQTYQLRSEESAERHLRFIERYRSYVINYSFGEELVRNYLTKKTKTSDELSAWVEYKELLENPKLPSELLNNK